MIRLYHHWPVVLLLAGAACSSPATESAPPPPPPVFTIAPHDVWAGSTVKIRSAAFHGVADTSGTVQFDGAQLALHRVDDTTVSVDLPATTMAGQHSISMQLGSVTKSLDPVTVYGFADSTSYPIQNDWDTYAWPRGTGHAMVLGGDDSDAIHVVDLDTHAITTVRNAMAHAVDESNRLQGPGFTYADDRTLLIQQPVPAGVFAPLMAMRVDSNITLTAAPTPAVQMQHAMRLSATTWFVSGSHGSAITTDPDSSSPPTFLNATVDGTGGNAYGVYISPRHDRATYAPVTISGEGVPVFDVPSGNVSFTAPVRGAATGADFSSDGSLLAFAGGGKVPDPHGQVLLMQTSDGTVIHDTTFATDAWVVSLDPVRPLLYVLTLVPGGSPSLLRAEVVVLDRATFRVVGSMATGQVYPATCNENFNGTLSVSSANSLYLFRGCYTNQSSVALRFTLPADDGLH